MYLRLCNGTAASLWFECRSESAQVSNRVIWTVDAEVVMTEYFNASMSASYSIVSRLSLPADPAKFGSTISCRVSKCDLAGTKVFSFYETFDLTGQWPWLGI